MKKIYIIFPFLILASILLKISSADEKAYQEMLARAKDAKSFSREKYIEEQTAHYKEEINKRLGGALEEQTKNTVVSELLKPHLEQHEMDWANNNFKKMLNAASVCYAAADIQCVTPIYMLSDHFDFSSLGFERYYGHSLKKETLFDFPIMYLAIQCGEKSVPALEYVIYNKEIRLDLRLQAIATLRLIDEKKAISAAMVAEDDFTGLMRDVLTEYLKDPSPYPAPWAVVGRYDRNMREKVEKHIRRKVGEAKAE